MTRPLKSHRDANYRGASSTHQRCGTCIMYVEGQPASCTFVERPIRAYMVCKYFEPKGGAPSNQSTKEDNVR